MRVLINFLLKLVATLFLGIIMWCTMVIALLLWDKRFMQMECGETFIWKKPRK